MIKDDAGISSEAQNSIDYSRVSELPIYVNSVEECTDTDRAYVLPDGKLWEYVTITEKKGEFTNMIPVSADSEGNTVGIIADHRYNSADILTECKGASAIGFIPAETGDTVRLDGVTFRNENVGEVTPGGIYLRFYDAEYSLLLSITAYSMEEHLDKIADDIEYDELGNLISFTINDAYEVAYIRMAYAYEESLEPVITVNEEIWVACDSYELWAPSKIQYIPEEWHGEVLSAIQRVNDIGRVSDDGFVRFAYTSDIHFEPSMNNYELICNVGKVASGVMQACGIPYIMITGDSTTQSSGYVLDDLKPNMDKVLSVLEPIPVESLMLTVGNHDGATGQKKVNGELLHYRYQLDNKERVETYFEWQRANIHKKFSNDGSYYYLDDAKTKTRYIMLNSFWNDFEGDEEGFTTDIYRSFFHNPLFGQEQLEWFSTVALDMPEGYSAVIGTHNIYEAEDKQVFYDIISAYNEKTVCETAHKSDMDFRSSAVSIDYSGAKGEIIAVFQGHNHADKIDTETLGIPCVTITTAGADVRDTDPPERVKGTDSETAIDIVTIDKAARKIYLTRLGVGEDRVIEY
ncbi:MAG: metallophosphoesterase [Clostridia bacterium]|nr:metallophosphoesterase [Clostridia bacterium]